MNNIPPPGRYKSHMQNQTPAANSEAKFHISPQEASDFTNISHSKNLTTKLRELEHQWTTKYPNYALKGRPIHQKNRGQIKKKIATP
jgi:hypothetical protein